MNHIWNEIRQNRLLWLLVMVPVVIAAQKISPGAHTLLFLLSLLAVIPLATLLSNATESVAAKTGDAVGGFSMQRLVTSPNLSLHLPHYALASSPW